MIFGITMGDSSGVGPEILAKAFGAAELRRPFVAFGDLAVMQRCADVLHLDVPLRGLASPGEYRNGFLNVVDLGLLKTDDVRPGEIGARSGAAARAYVVAAAQAAASKFGWRPSRSDLASIISSAWEFQRARSGWGADH